MSAVEKIGLDDPRWLGLLLNAAEKSRGDLKVARRPAEASRDAQDALWSSGVLLGAGTPEPALTLRGDPESAFVQLVSFEMRRALGVFHSDWHPRWQVGALLAACSEEWGVASVFEAATKGEAISPAEERRLLEVIAAQLRRRAYLSGNPVDGLPLHAGLAAIDTRTFVRLAASYRLRPERLRSRAVRYLAQTSRLKALFIELVAGLFAATQTTKSPDWSRGAGRQVRALTMQTADRRRATAGLKAPRDASELLKGVPVATRSLLVEQAALAAMLASRWNEAGRDHLAVVGLPAAQLVSIEARAVAFLAQYQASASALAKPVQGSPLDAMVRQANDAVLEAAEAVAQEIRETGELGLLLARMAQGETLSDEERGQMREQLIDLAKVVPSLAIFAAPGGMLLLPLVLKYLPFDLRPSAFQNRPSSPPPPKRPKSSSS